MRTKELLDFYSREDVASAIVSFGNGREVVGRRLRGDYNKRPDILAYPGDVSSLAKSGATSFHASVELWRNPLSLVPGMARKEIDENRIGWDFLIDLDGSLVPKEYGKDPLINAKWAAKYILDALESFGLEKIPIKFSGRAGFHILVPFKLFPREIGGLPSEKRFPEIPRLISEYLAELIRPTFDKKLEEIHGSKSKVLEAIGKDPSEYYERKERVKERVIAEKVEKRILYSGSETAIRQRLSTSTIPYPGMEEKIGKELEEEKKNLDSFGAIKIDSVLISPRHLVRAPYSFNEKSWLVSVPIKKSEILSFSQENARPENVGRAIEFVGGSGNAQALLEATLEFGKARDEKDKRTEERKLSEYKKKEGEKPREKIKLSESVFPPCINAIFSEKGVEDGRKRRLFILQGFLQSAGWNQAEISEKCAEWNNSLKNPLQPVYIEGQLSYMGRSKREKGLVAPNCATDGFYREMGICRPDSFCSGVKNPITSAFRRLPKRRAPSPEPAGKGKKKRATTRKSKPEERKTPL